MEENEQQTQQHLQSLLEHIGLLQSGEQKLPRSRSRIFGQLIEKVRPTETRERSKSASSQISDGSKSTKSSKKSSVTSLAQQQQQLENQLKDKIHEIVCRRQSKQEHGGDQRLDERKLSKADIEQIAKLAGLFFNFNLFIL